MKAKKHISVLCSLLFLCGLSVESFAERNHGRRGHSRGVGQQNSNGSFTNAFGITTDRFGNRFDQFGRPLPDNRSDFQRTFDQVQGIIQQSFSNINQNQGRGAEAGNQAAEKIKQKGDEIRERAQETQKQLQENTAKQSEEANKSLAEFIKNDPAQKETSDFISTFGSIIDDNGKENTASTAQNSASQIIQLINEQTQTQIQALQQAANLNSGNFATPPVQTADFASKLGSMGPRQRDRNPLETAMAATQAGRSPKPELPQNSGAVIGNFNPPGGAYGVRSSGRGITQKKDVPRNIQKNSYNYPSGFFR